MTTKGQDQNYLRNDQYKNSTNLSARRQLNARFTTNPYSWFKWVFDQFEGPSNAHVLELGAGPAWLWSENAERIPHGWQITVSDFSPGMVTEERQNLQSIEHPFDLAIIDAQSIPYEISMFDTVIANHMLHHVPDLTQALSEIKRVLKPTGKLYAATNGQRHMHELYELVLNYGREQLGGSGNSSFTLEKGQKDLAQFFQNITIRRYEDALEITEVEPLVAYILSGGQFSEDIRGQSADFHEYVKRAFGDSGSFHITKDVGLFIASL